MQCLSHTSCSQLTLQPSWRKAANPNTRSGREIRCENGNPWDLLLETVDTWIIDWIEGGVNTLINVVNDFIDNLPWPLDGIGRPISRFCMPTLTSPTNVQPATGTGGGTSRTLPSAKTLACRAALTCCVIISGSTPSAPKTSTSPATRSSFKGFQSISGLQQEFATAFGSSYEVLDPTLVDLVEQARISTTKRSVAGQAQRHLLERLVCQLAAPDQIVSLNARCTRALPYFARCFANASGCLTPRADHQLFLRHRGRVLPRTQQQGQDEMNRLRLPSRTRRFRLPDIRWSYDVSLRRRHQSSCPFTRGWWSGPAWVCARAQRARRPLPVAAPRGHELHGRLDQGPHCRILRCHPR